MFYHHHTIRKYTIGILELFNNLKIPRYNSDNELIKEINVPIKFGNRDKAYLLSEQDMENIQNRNTQILPRMVISFDGLSKAQERDTNKLAKINKIKRNKTKQFMYNSVSYDFSYTLHIACKSFTDATMIIEQIAPLFRPDITLKINELDFNNEYTSVPISIGDFDVTLPDSLDENDIRVIEIELPLTVKGNLYLPIQESEVIQSTNLSLDIDGSIVKLSDDYEIN